MRLLPILALGLVVAACAARHKGPRADSAAGRSESDRANQSVPDAASQPVSSATSQSPLSATVQIDYAHKSDFLRSVTVTKFTAASVIPTRRREEKDGTSIVRFEGGVAVWQIRADESIGRELLTELPLIAAGKKFARKQVTYGELPKSFVQTAPDSGPPEALEAGSYYVFAVERASDVTSFEAIKVQADGAIESYDAEPRAGDSYALCCNVSEGFATAENP